ncbi:hypothetical protein SGPA1_10231 [Streptomyces misionensis JCM 4497]
MGHDGAVPRIVQLRPRRSDRRSRVRSRAADARPHPGLAQPVAELGRFDHRRGHAAQCDGQPHHHRDDPLQGQDLRLGRGQRGVRRRRQRPAAQLGVPQRARRRLHRGGIPHRPGGRPRGQALLQRLQHRELVRRQDPGRLQHGQGLQVPRRAHRLRRLPEPLRLQRTARQLPDHSGRLRGPRRGRPGDRARHRPGVRHRLLQRRQGVHERLPLYRDHHLGHPGQRLLALRGQPSPLRRQRQQEAGLQRRDHGPRGVLDRRWRGVHRCAACGERGPVSRRAELLDDRGDQPADLGLQRAGQPDLVRHLRQPADGLLRGLATLPGRLRQPDHSRHEGGHLAVQRRCEPAVEAQLGRHRHRGPVRTVPGRHGSGHRQRHRRRAVDLQRPGQPEMDPRLIRT